MTPPDRLLRNALAFFLLSHDERVRITKEIANVTETPSWLDPDVRFELADRKYTKFKPLPEGQKAQPGDITAKAGDGKIWTGEITDLGRTWFEMGKN